MSDSLPKLYPAIASSKFQISLLPLAWNLLCFSFTWAEHSLDAFSHTPCVRIMSLWRNRDKEERSFSRDRTQKQLMKGFFGSETPKQFFLLLWFSGLANRSKYYCNPWFLFIMLIFLFICMLHIFLFIHFCWIHGNYSPMEGVSEFKLCFLGNDRLHIYFSKSVFYFQIGSDLWKNYKIV